MKHYSIDWLMKKYKLREHDGKPVPFPGKYPTRFAYRVWIKGRKGTVDYCGKPNVEAFKRFGSLAKLTSLMSNKYVFFEFDRRGIITRWGSDAKKNSVHVVLHRVYHPFSGADPLYTFKQPWTRKKISGFVAYYSPIEKLKVAQINDHKTWLRSLGFIAPLPGEKKIPGKKYLQRCGDCGLETAVTILHGAMFPVRCGNCGTSGDLRFMEVANGL